MSTDPVTSNQTFVPGESALADTPAVARADSARTRLPVVALLRLCRWYYGLPLGATLCLTIVYARDGQMAGEWSGAVWASIALALIIAGGYVLNDVCDCRVDRINAPRRPIASGRTLAGVALLWAVLLTLAGLTLAAAFCRSAFAVLLAGVAAGLIFYNLTSKRLGLGKQLLVGLLMASIYPLAIAQAAGALGGRGRTLTFFAGWLFLTSFAYEILKDIRDIPGDRLSGGRPSWIERDTPAARRTARAAVLLAAALLAGPAWVGCGAIYMAIIPAAWAAAVLSALLPVRPAMAAIYLECVLVGVAASADLWS